MVVHDFISNMFEHHNNLEFEIRILLYRFVKIRNSFQPSEASETKIQLPGLEDVLDEPPPKRLREHIKIDVDK